MPSVFGNGFDLLQWHRKSTNGKGIDSWFPDISFKFANLKSKIVLTEVAATQIVPRPAWAMLFAADAENIIKISVSELWEQTRLNLILIRLMIMWHLWTC